MVPVSSLDFRDSIYNSPGFSGRFAEINNTESASFTFFLCRNGDPYLIGLLKPNLQLFFNSHHHNSPNKPFFEEHIVLGFNLTPAGFDLSPLFFNMR